MNVAAASPMSTKPDVGEGELEEPGRGRDVDPRDEAPEDLGHRGRGGERVEQRPRGGGHEDAVDAEADAPRQRRRQEVAERPAERPADARGARGAARASAREIVTPTSRRANASTPSASRTTAHDAR